MSPWISVGATGEFQWVGDPYNHVQKGCVFVCRKGACNKTNLKLLLHRDIFLCKGVCTLGGVLHGLCRQTHLVAGSHRWRDCGQCVVFRVSVSPFIKRK